MVPELHEGRTTAVRPAWTRLGINEGHAGRQAGVNPISGRMGHVRVLGSREERRGLGLGLGWKGHDGRQAGVNPISGRVRGGRVAKSDANR